jgi:NAD(P)-dependent dehydrogenase (short-subunit alcohol dehydrogenase family)
MVVHNAGVGELPSGSRLADEKGIDVVFKTNFLGSFLMTHLLGPHLTSTARVVFTSSTGHYSAGKTVLHARPPKPQHTGILGTLKSYLIIQPSSAIPYSHSKAQQVLLAHLLQRHFSGTRRTAHAFSPGFSSTPIFSTIPLSLQSWVSNPLFAVLKATEKWVALDADEGAKTGIWLASCGEEVEGGGYWDFGERRTSLVDLAKGQLGEEKFRERCEEVWRGWEEDAGCTWSIDV